MHLAPVPPGAPRGILGRAMEKKRPPQPPLSKEELARIWQQRPELRGKGPETVRRVLRREARLKALRPQRAG